MSAPQYDGPPPDGAPQGPVAAFRPSRWPGLIWVVPAVALGIVLWLGARAYFTRGPDVIVRFPTEGGIQAGQTKVEYRGVTVGQVSSVRLSRSLRTMAVTLSFDATMRGHLGRGTVFWIAGTSVSLTNLASVKALIAGPHIGVAPHDGPLVRHVAGLTRAPVLRNQTGDETLTLLTGNPGNLSRGAAITFRDFKVGDVARIRMEPSGTRFDIDVVISRQYAHLVTTESRFWDAGAVRLSNGSGGPALQFQSLPALVSGAIAFETPGPGPPAHDGSRFTLYPARSAARFAPGPHAVPYRVVLADGSHGLAAGDEVTLEGQRAGVVTSVHPRYDPAAQAIRTAVRLVLEPRLIERVAGQPWHLANATPQMNAMLDALIGHGLRARLTRSLPMVGGETIALDRVPGAAPAHLEPGTPPQIPAVGGSGAGQIMTQVSDILVKIDALPLPAIARNIHAATRRLAQLSGSAQTRRTLLRLDRTVTHLDAITRQTDARLPAILAGISRSAREAGSALRSARALLAQQGEAANAPESETLPRTLYELTRAAESLRALADYLTGGSGANGPSLRPRRTARHRFS
ncbi:MAG: intermembrane transport protein PqiB [Acetobacteraceae bacterium]